MSEFKTLYADAKEIQASFERIENLLKQNELAKIELQKEYLQRKSMLEPERPPISFDETWNCKYEKGIVHIRKYGHIPFLDLKHRDRNYYYSVNDYYMKSLLYAIQKSNMPICFSLAYVLIVQYFADKSQRDFDNQYKKFIFDALKNSKLILNDSWENLSYSEAGALDRKNPRTEIYIGARNQKDVIDTFLPG
jgi:hypothetical protein